MEKQELRKFAKEIRKTLDIENISATLREKLSLSDEYKKSKNIMIFYPLNSEINLLPLLSDETKKFYLPRINQETIECCPYNKEDLLKESRFHTKEPVCNACDKTCIDLVIAPALACDFNNYRLGYGGGYYDRFLKDFSGIKISCVPKELYLKTVYPELHDIKMDTVIFS